MLPGGAGPSLGRQGVAMGWPLEVGSPVVIAGAWP